MSFSVFAVSIFIWDPINLERNRRIDFHRQVLDSVGMFYIYTPQN